MNKVEKLLKKLTTPGREFSPMPFWFLNDAFSDQEIVRQLTEFEAKGVYGVVLHPRIGIPETIEYLSDAFMHSIKKAVETAARLNMKIILYDEAMYPSGSAHGLVAAANPRFASQGIILSGSDEEGVTIAKTKSGKFIQQVQSGGHIRGIHFGEDDGQKNAPLAADLLSQESVDTFIRLTHERYYAVLKKYFGTTIIGFFTDEPSALGRGARRSCFPWTWGFEDTVTSLGGRLEDLEGLFSGEENDTVKLYRKAIFERECDVYYQSLSNWCKAHGIALMGHPHRGDDIECERFFDVPGQDIVLRWIAPETGGLTGIESVQAKCSADAARIMGRRRNLNECYGACCKDKIPWYFTVGDLKWYTDWLGVRGVNFFIPHAFYYSVVGKRKDERPPDVGPNNIWWRHFGIISTYLARISALMTDSRNLSRVCVMCENRHMPVDEVAPFYENQIEFNYVPYRFLPEEAEKDGKLCIGDNAYEFIFGDTKKQIHVGKKIASVEDVPYRDIYTDVPCPTLRVSHLEKDGVEVFFLTNEGEEAICTQAAVESSGQLVAMNLWTGSIASLPCRQEDGRLVFPLTLARRESVLLLVDTTCETSFEALVQEKHFLEPSFTLVREDEEAFLKVYEGKLPDGRCDKAYLCVCAEEMVECFVNDRFAGVSFWNEHEFFLSPYLKDGENTVRLHITGSAVNKYTEHKISYGLIKRTK